MNALHEAPTHSLTIPNFTFLDSEVKETSFQKSVSFSNENSELFKTPSVPMILSNNNKPNCERTPTFVNNFNFITSAIKLRLESIDTLESNPYNIEPDLDDQHHLPKTPRNVVNASEFKSLATKSENKTTECRALKQILCENNPPQQFCGAKELACGCPIF